MGVRESPEGAPAEAPTTVERTYAKMRDGTRIYIEVFRPRAKGRFPAILMRNPYHGIESPPETRGPGTHMDLVQRGYVVVEAEVRGTGISEGEFHFLGHEAEDGYDTILWIRKQPWSDGNVGLAGISYLSMNQFAVAAQQPLGLKALFAGFGAADPYTEFVYPGGILSTLSFNWAQRHLMRVIAPPLTGLRRPSALPEPVLRRIREAVHRHRLLRDHARLVNDGCLFDATYASEWIDHPTSDDYWQRISPCTYFHRIRIPVFLIGGWFDFFIEGVLRAFQEIQAPKKLVVGPWFHGEDAGMNRTQLELRWFDYWLKGVDNGIMDEPPVQYYLLGKGTWQESTSWPAPARTLSLYFGPGEGPSDRSLNGGSLSPQPPTGGPFADRITHDPNSPVPSIGFRKVDIGRAEAAMLTYTTGSLSHDLEVVGQPKLHLVFSTNSQDVDWIAKLTQVSSDGRSTVFSSGALRGSHHLSHQLPQKLVPNTVYEADIALAPIAKVFDKGSRLRLDVSNSDFPILFPSNIPSESRIHLGEPKPSYLELPVVGRADFHLV